MTTKKSVHNQEKAHIQINKQQQQQKQNPPLTKKPNYLQIKIISKCYANTI